MLDTYKKLHHILDARERRNAALLFGLILVMGLLEVAGVASIMPFIAVVSNPDMIQSNTYLAILYDWFGFTNAYSFLGFLGGAVFILVMGSLVFKAITYWAMARFAHMRNYTLSARLLHGYLGQPYSWFLNRHSSNLGKTILNEVQHVVNQSLMPGVQLIASAITAIFLIILIVIVEPVVAFVAMALLGGSYIVIYISMRRYIGSIGADRLHADTERFQVAQEALAGIKDVKVLGLEDAYTAYFKEPAIRFARHQAVNQIIAQLPRFLLEGLAFGGMILIILFLLSTKQGKLDEVMQLVALYAFAGYRLLPALQQVYQSLAQLRFSKPGLDVLHADLLTTVNVKKRNESAQDTRGIQRIELNQSIVLNNINYSYPQAENSTLTDLNLTIPVNQTVAFVGSTGAGKTTVVDLILGLLEPQHGEVCIDNTIITKENVRAWQVNLGYVPQHIFLTDDTVAGNIAFGVPENEINQPAVERAARIAELHDFVINEMPDGYKTMVGERGVRLSGGQRQRIGIARALYHDPAVLILDEATSALDNITEKAVMGAVHNLSHRKTVILIAHRLSTVKDADIIFLLEYGKLIDSGTYQDLISNNQHFQQMAGLTN